MHANSNSMNNPNTSNTINNNNTTNSSSTNTSNNKNQYTHNMINSIAYNTNLTNPNIFIKNSNNISSNNNRSNNNIISSYTETFAKTNKDTTGSQVVNRHAKDSKSRESARLDTNNINATSSTTTTKKIIDGTSNSYNRPTSGYITSNPYTTTNTVATGGAKNPKPGLKKYFLKF